MGWSDLDLTHGRVHVRAKPQYDFLPKDWEERIVPFSQEVADILRKHPRVPNCALVFPSPQSHLNYRYLHDRCRQIAKAAGLDEKEWHLHKFRDSAATRWLRAGIDVRTVQAWLGHESLATTPEMPGALQGDAGATGQNEAAPLAVMSTKRSDWICMRSKKAGDRAPGNFSLSMK